MPTVITPTNLYLDGYDATIITWTALALTQTATSSNTGLAVEICNRADRSVQFDGTFDGATVVLQGSNDGTNWYSLTDPQGNAISKTAGGLEQVEELTYYVRPYVSTSTNGNTSITIVMIMKGGKE